MKRKTLLISCLILLLCTPFLTVHAQQGMKPFSHLGVGLDISTTGVGIDLSVPVQSYLVLRGGFSMLPYKYSDTYYVKYNKEKLNNFISENPEVQQALTDQGLGTDVNQLSDDIDLDAKLSLINGKILVDIYPIKSSSFHVVAGLYFGKSKLLTLDGSADPSSLRFLNIVNQYSDDYYGSSIVVENYQIDADRNGKIDAALKVNSVKPYLGLGIGNDIPKKRVGFKFEIGAMFQGKPKIVSDNGTVVKVDEDGSSDGVIDLLQKFSVYPMVSFKLTGRIF